MSEPPPRTPVGLGTRAARGAAVTLVGQGARISVQVVSVVVLARLLSPHDYGLLAMVLTIVGVGEIFRDFGLSSAAIQAPSLSRGQRDNLFWLNAGLGLVLSLIVFLTAPLVALLYGEPELVPLTQVLSVTFLINGLTTQYRADRNRSMKFTILAVSDVAAAVIGLGCAVVAAVAGWEYWALAVQQLVQCIIGLVILVASAHWLPHLPDRSAPMAGLLRYGWHLVGTQLIGYASNNIDSVIIGTRFGAAQLGIYNRGFQLLMQPLGQVRAPSTRVALPVLSRLGDDAVRFGEFIVRGQQALGYTLVAGLGLVVAAAEPLTAILLGNQWAEVTPILRLIAIAGIFQTIAYVGYWIYLARGLTADLFRYTLLTSAIKISCVVIGSSFGIIGVAAGFAIAPALAWPISLTWLSRRTEIPIRQLFAGAFRILLVVTAGAGGGWAATIAVGSDSAWLQLLAALCAGLLVYGLALLVPPIRRDIVAVIRIARLVPRVRGNARAGRRP